METELTELRAEVATLREESKRLREHLNQVMRLIGVYEPEPGESWPDILGLEVDSLAIRDPDNPHSIPIHLHARGGAPRISVCDPKNRSRFELEVTESGTALEIRNAEGNAIITLCENDQRCPQVTVNTDEGIPRAGLQMKNGMPIFNIVDEKNRALVMMSTSDDGGELIVANRNGRAAVTSKATQLGGLVSVFEPSGQIMGSFFGTSATGMLDVRGPQGAMAVAITSSDVGGTVAVCDVEGNLMELLPSSKSAPDDEPDESEE